MTTPVFSQTTIAVIWDFDRTLIPGYMQEPLFRRFDVDASAFWAEVNALPAFHREHGAALVSDDTIYLNHILTYVREGRFAGLNNRVLRELGRELAFYPGLPDFFPAIKQLVEATPAFAKHDITLEHYVVSTGLRQMILGSAIAEHVDGVWACDFAEYVAPPGFVGGVQQELEEEPELKDIVYVIDNTTKTRAVFEINKGANKHPDEISVNVRMDHEDRRIPFENMIYVADGPSDVPVFSILNQYGGKTYAVYAAGSVEQFRQVKTLSSQGRVQGFGPAVYTEGTHTYMWLTTAVDDIALAIVERREEALRDRVGKAPRHILEKSPPPPVAPPTDIPAQSPEPPHSDDGE
jgi:haloacid dehalogenase-like hydrolase